MLKGLPVLVVEDAALVAAMAEDMLLDMGARVIGPAATVAQGLALAEPGGVDVALLDVNVRGDPVTPLADMLRQAGVPIVFATGYGVAPKGIHEVAPVIGKPYTQDDLGKALAAACGR